MTTQRDWYSCFRSLKKPSILRTVICLRRKMEDCSRAFILLGRSSVARHRGKFQHSPWWAVWHRELVYLVPNMSLPLYSNLSLSFNLTKNILHKDEQYLVLLASYCVNLKNPVSRLEAEQHSSPELYSSMSDNKVHRTLWRMRSVAFWWAAVMIIAIPQQLHNGSCCVRECLRNC